MEIIGNITSNHIHYIKNLSQQSDELIIFSPFCYQDFGDFFQEITHSKIKGVVLITTLKPDEASNKSNSLVSFIDELNKRKIVWNIKIDNKLHGKMYFFKKNNSFHNVIITSANLTDNGMNKNHEWGCLISDTKQIEELYQQAINVNEIIPINEDQVIKLVIAVDNYKKNHPQNIQTKEQVDLSEILQKTTGIKWDAETRFFLKPYGSNDDKIYDGDFSEEEFMHFSKRRPNSVRINDLLICYAVGSTKLTSVFRVLSEPQNTDNEDDRWPWFVEVENLTPEYGKKWFESDNTLSMLSNRFLEKNKENYLTYNGGKTLGAFQFGADKIRLNEDFGKFLIKMINNTFI